MLNHRKLKIEQKHELHLKQGVKSGALTIFKILICSFSCGPLFVFLFFLLWTIVCLFALFLVDHCLSICSFSCETMVHKKKNKKTNNGPQEKEQKDKQWSTRKRAKRQTMVHIYHRPVNVYLRFKIAG
jgi:hypothetical protein